MSLGNSGRFYSAALLVGLLALASGTGCGSSSDSGGSPPDTTSYPAEVMPSALLQAYGTWDYQSASAGGAPWVLDFERLRLKPYGRFECLVGTQVILAGAVRVGSEGSLVTFYFVPDTAEDQVRWPGDGYPGLVWASQHATLYAGLAEDQGHLYIGGANDAAHFIFARAP